MKKKKLILAVAILTLIMVVVGATYAYFVAQTGSGQSANINVQAGTTDSLRFEVTNDLNIYASVENFAEGQDNLAKDTNLKATLKPNNNTNEATYNYYVYLDISKNELEYTTEDNKPELLLKVTKPDGTELTTIDGLEYKSVVNNKGEEVSGFDITTKKELITIADNYEIHASGSELTQEWNIEIILVNLGSDQNKNTNKKIEAEAKIQEDKILLAVLKRPGEIWNAGEYVPSWDWGRQKLITKVVFEQNLIIHEDAEATYDMSEAQDNSIVGYAVKNGEEETYTLYISSNKKIWANVNMSSWFGALGFYNGIEEIIGLENVDFSKVTSMGSMFSDCRRLTSLDVSSFDTSQVTYMGGMFSFASGLTSLDVSNFDTSQVTNMGSMFYGVSSLTTLDLSNFDTSQVTNMGSMFSGARGLTALDVSSFDTSQVTDMHGMFNGTSGLTTLDLSNFDTSQVTEMRYMFSGASGLTALDLSNFDTSKVTDMGWMFSGASGLTTLDLRNFDTSKVTSMSRMFSGASGLTALDVSNFDTSQVTDMTEMFEGASSLTKLDLSKFDTSKVTNMPRMFAGCSSLTELDISSMTFDSVEFYYYMFEGVPNNIHIKVKDEAAKAFIEARLAEANITEAVVEIANI